MMKRWKLLGQYLVLLAVCLVGLVGCCHDNDHDDDSTSEVVRLAITANAEDNTATIFDANTLEVTHSSVALSGEWPWEITLSSDGGTAYVMNRDSNSISIVNLSTGTETRTIALTGSGPAKAVIASDGFLYVCYYGSAFISKVNIAAATPIEDSAIPLSIEEVGLSSSWTSIAATPAGDVLYVGSNSPAALARVDVGTGTMTDDWDGVYGIPEYIWDIEINSAGLAYLATYDEGQVTTWDTTTDDFGPPVASGQPTEWMVDMVLEGSMLFGTFYGNDTNGGVVLIDTAADFDNYAYSQDDDSYYDVSLPFAFSFLGSDYTDLTVGSNGTVAFNDYADSYDEDINGLLGFSPNNEDLDSEDGYLFNYSSMLFDDHAVFQWSTATNDDEPNPNTVTIFEVVLFADGRARIDYAFSMPDAINEDDEYLYGIGDGSATPVVDMRALLGSPFEVERRSFLWNPAVSTTSVTEVPFEWEGTGVLHLPVTGLPHGVAVSDNYIFVPLTKDYDGGLTSTTVAVYDRATGLPADPLTVGAGPRAIAIQPAADE